MNLKEKYQKLLMKIALRREKEIDDSLIIIFFDVIEMDI